MYVKSYKMQRLKNSIELPYNLLNHKKPRSLGVVREVLRVCLLTTHVHIVVKIPPKHSVSEIMGILKGKTAIRIFNNHKHLKDKLYLGNHFWVKGYCVDTVGLNEDMIRRYVKYQEDKEEYQN
jgi:putative transposase